MSNRKSLMAALAVVVTVAGLNAPASWGRSKPTILDSLPSQVKILGSASVPGTGLTAWLIGRQAHVGVVYTPKSGAYLLEGHVITTQGRVSTGVALEMHYFSHHDFHALGTAVLKAPSVHEGHSGPLVHVFFDPNCIFCHRLWESTQPAIKAGKLQVDWMPVAIIKASSLAKAAAIMGSHDPVKALNMDETSFNTATEEGGIKPMAHLTKRAAQPVRHNTKLMHQYGLFGTPTIVYRGKNGGWHLEPGYIKASELLKLVGGGAKGA